MIVITKEQIVAALVMAIKKDRANRYTLQKDWALPKLAFAVPDFANNRFLIKDSVIMVKAYRDGYQSDGCTLSPDEIGNWKTVIGALFHDPWYQSISEISKCWGWPEGCVRKLGDELFACILIGTGTPRWIARVYLTGLRWFGGITRWVGASFGMVTLALVMTGCSGCAIPNHFNDQPVTPPQYQETTNGTGPR